MAERVIYSREEIEERVNVPQIVEIELRHLIEERLRQCGMYYRLFSRIKTSSSLARKYQIKEYNEEKQYAMILSSSSAAPLTYLQAPVTVGDPSLDITADLVRVLNDAYVKTKNQKD